MNVITPTHAYSLYPFATFIQRRSLVCSTNGSDQKAALQKYRNRGWEMVKSPPVLELVSRKTDFKTRTRYVGDRFCWTIKLPGISAATSGEDGLDEDEFEHQEIIHTHSWSLVYREQEPLEAVLQFGTFRDRRLRHHYTIEDNLIPYVEDVADKIIKCNIDPLVSIHFLSCTMLIKPLLVPRVMPHWLRS
jgi:hypothetical protein